MALKQWQRGRDVPVVPQRRRPRRPFEPALDVDVLLIHLEQIPQDHVTLWLVQSNDPVLQSERYEGQQMSQTNSYTHGYAHRHRAIDIQRLPARRWVRSNQWVLALDVLRSRIRIITVEVSMRGTVDSVLAVNDAAKGGRELLVGAVAGGPKCVAADGGDGVVVQVCYAGWLALVDEIGMPLLRADRASEAGWPFGGSQLWPDDSSARETWYVRHLRMNFDLMSQSRCKEWTIRLDILHQSSARARADPGGSGPGRGSRRRSARQSAARAHLFAGCSDLSAEDQRSRCQCER